MNLKRWFLTFGLHGAAVGAISLVISLFAVYGFGGSVRSATSATALFSLGNLAGAILVSTILDKMKRFEKLITLSLLLSSYSLIGMYFTNSLPLYFLLCFFLGFSASFAGPTLTLFFNRNLKDLAYRRALNFLNTFNSFGVTCGMLSGSFILKVLKNYAEISKMRVIFVVAASIFVVGAILTKGKSEEVSIRVRPSLSVTKVVFSKISSFHRDVFTKINIFSLPARVRTFIMATFLVFAGANIFLSVFTIYLKESLALTSQSVFLLYALNNLATNIAFMLSHRVIKKQKDRVFIRAVIVIRLSIILLVALLNFLGLKGNSRSIIEVTFVLFGLSWPFFYMPLTFEAGELVPARERGRIFGLLNISINTAVISASFLAGSVALKFGFSATFLIGALVLLSGGMIFFQMSNQQD